MKCFYHHDEEAVGSCKSCGKGVCPACLVDLGKGLACRQRCEDDVRALIALIDNSLQMGAKSPGILRSNRQMALGSAGFTCAVGTAFLAWGLLSNPINALLAVLGGLFLVYGFTSLGRALRMPRVAEPPAATAAADEFDQAPGLESLTRTRSG